MKWYVLEWNALDDRIDLYEWESCRTEAEEVHEEIVEGLHSLSGVLVMDGCRLANLFKAVETFNKTMKGGEQQDG